MLMSTSVLPQLQTIETELASQAKQLEAQLASIHEKLTGIQTVLSMFSETTDTATVTEELPSEDEPVLEDAAISSDELEEEAPVVAAPKATQSKATKVKKAAPKKAATKKAPAKKTAAKKDGRTASWQKYTRPGVKNESIPDAVRLILATQPENDFKIVEVMDSLSKRRHAKGSIPQGSQSYL